jgi:hypothetical protein
MELKKNQIIELPQDFSEIERKLVLEGMKLR